MVDKKNRKSECRDNIERCIVENINKLSKSKGEEGEKLSGYQALEMFDDLVVRAEYFESPILHKLAIDLVSEASLLKFEEVVSMDEDGGHHEDREKAKAWDDKYGSVYYRVIRWIYAFDGIYKEWANPTYDFF